MKALRKPRALRPGATLGIAAPGGPVDPEALRAGCRLLEAAGFRVRCRDDVTARRGYLAGDDERRIAELVGWWSDPEVDGIVCARGGYGCDRILERLDADLVRRVAKPLVGYSDVTALLLWQARRAGLAGFHGPMLERGGELGPEALEALVAQLTGRAELPVVLQGCGGLPGSGEGPLLGGSLTLMAASLGTPWEPDCDGAILMLEEVNERPYRVDRMLQQLRAAGKLRGVAGLAFGDLGSCVDDRYGTQAEAVVLEFAESVGVPCVTGLPFGHGDANATWPVGGRATIDGSRGEVRIVEQGVEVAS